MKDFTQTTKDEAIAILNKEVAERQDNISRRAPKIRNIALIATDDHIFNQGEV